MTKFINKINVYAWIYSVHERIYVDVRSYANSLSSVFFLIFDSTIWCTVMGVPEHMMLRHDKKVMNCAQLGCHSFRSYSYISRYSIMRNEIFVYLGIYSVYLEIYEYGVLVQGVRFPDVGCHPYATYFYRLTKILSLSFWIKNRLYTAFAYFYPEAIGIILTEFSPKIGSRTRL